MVFPLNLIFGGRKMKAPMRVMVTGAAGQIGYSLVAMIARGAMCGPDQPVILHLLDIPIAEEALKGVVMEIKDAAFPLVKGKCTAPSDPTTLNIVCTRSVLPRSL